MRTWMLAFFAGVLFFTQLNFLPELYWLALLSIWGVVIFLSADTKSRQLLATRVPYFSLSHVQYYVVLCAFFVSGFSVALYHANQYYLFSLPEQWQGKTILVEGEVVSIPKSINRKQSFEFKVIRATYSGEEYSLGKIKLNWYRTAINIQAGQKWKLKVRLKRPHSMQNPGGFDYEKWLLQKSIVATGYVYKNKHELIGRNNWSINALRQLIYNRLVDKLDGYPELGIIMALSIGERSLLTDEQWEVFRNTGTAHLIAISGLHIGLIAGLFFLLARKFFSISRLPLKGVPIQIVAAILSVTIAFVYSALAGFSIPTVRAFVMYSIFIGVFIMRRNTHGFDVLLVALLIMLIINPFAVLNAGFWLSYFAVFSIVYFVTGKHKHSKIKLFVNTQIAIFFALTPVLILFFQTSSLVSPVVNLYAVPLMSMIIIPACLLGVGFIVLDFSFAERWFELLHVLFEYFWRSLSWFSDLSFASYEHGVNSWFVIFVAGVGVIIIFFPKRYLYKWLGLVLFLPLLTLHKNNINQGDAIISFLDVGQGTSVVVKTRNHVLVYDAGAKFSSGFNLGERVIYPFIQNQNSVVNKLVISHGDNDHIGGAGFLINKLKIKNADSSVPHELDLSQGKNSESRAEYCHAGKSWLWDDVRFTYLSPTLDQLDIATKNSRQKKAGSANNVSCVLRIEFKNYSVLLTGDIQKETEYKLAAMYGEQLKSDVLLVPHHGSNTSSVKRFIQLVNPNYAVITVGHLNRYRLPNKKVLRRYKNYTHATVLQTAKTGTIQFHIQYSQQLHKHIAAIRLYRQSKRGFWLHNK